MHNDTPLETAWERYKAGVCGWAEVQAEQDALLPHCTAHDAPASATIDGTPVCAACIAEAGDELRLWLKSMQLISGGVRKREGAES